MLASRHDHPNYSDKRSVSVLLIFTFRASIRYWHDYFVDIMSVEFLNRILIVYGHLASKCPQRHLTSLTGLSVLPSGYPSVTRLLDRICSPKSLARPRQGVYLNRIPSRATPGLLAGTVDFSCSL
jgi:hypothetical protein